ncbi:MAG: lysylphosphatidylglycerol synthase domain-containing protein [Candidatus Scalindua sp.]
MAYQACCHPDKLYSLYGQTRRTMKIIRRTILITAIFFIGFAVYTQWDKLQNYQWDFQISWLVLSLITLMASLFLGPFGWYLVLRSLRQKLSYKKSFYIWTTSSVAKYIPGTIWSYVSRAAHAKNEDIKIGPIAASIYIEQILLVITSLAVGIPIFIKSSNPIITPLYLILALITLFIIIHPKFFNLLTHIPGRVGKAVENVQFSTTTSLSGLYLFYIFHWLIFSIAFIFFINSISPVMPEQYFYIGSALAASFFVSFIFIIFPSGIGIRESILYFLLLNYFPETVSLAVAVGSRLWLITGELFAVAIAIYWSKKWNSYE